MTQTNIINKIAEAENLILDLKPELHIFSNFDYQILLKGKEDPRIFLQISSKNVFTSIVTKKIQDITSKNSFFTIGVIENKPTILLNIII